MRAIVVVAARVCTRLGAGLPRVLAQPCLAARLDADAMRGQAVALSGLVLRFCVASTQTKLN